MVLHSGSVRGAFMPDGSNFPGSYMLDNAQTGEAAYRVTPIPYDRNAWLCRR